MGHRIYTIITSFNNNEIAILILLTILLISFKTFRTCCISIIKVLAEFLWKNKIFQITILELGLYFCLITFLLYKVGFWNLSLLKDSILWFLLSGFILYKDIIINRNWQDTMKSYLLKVISISAIYEFITNIICLPIWSLLIIIPIICVLQLISVYSKNKDEYKNTSIFADNFIAIIGFGILIYIVCHLFGNFAILLKGENLKAFILPIIYTLTFLPFSFINKVFSEYQQVYKRLLWRKDIKIPVNSIYIYKIYKFCKFNFEKLNKFLFFLTSSNYLNQTTSIDDLIIEYKNRTTFLEYNSSCIGFEINKILNLFEVNGLKIEDYKDIEYDDGYGNYYGDKLLKMGICSFDNIMYSVIGTNQVIQRVKISYSKSKSTPKDLSKETDELYLTLTNYLFSFCFNNEYLNKNLLQTELNLDKDKFIIENRIIIHNAQLKEYKFSISVKEPICSDYYVTKL